MMANAMALNQIPESQYAKKRSRSIEAVALKRLFFDYLRIYKIAGVIISNDARVILTRCP